MSRDGLGVAVPAGVVRPLLAFAALAALAGCAPAQTETRASGTTDASGFLAFAARAPGAAAHWSTDVALRDAPAGTYALVAGAEAPAEPPSVTQDGAAVQCARAGARACALPNGLSLVALIDIGPGGSGMLRAAFTNGAAAWFSLVRVTGPRGEAHVTIRVVSESIGKGDHAQPFAIEMRPSPASTGNST